MKSTLMRSAALAALALGLAACGGGSDDDYVVRGTITKDTTRVNNYTDAGVRYAGLVLKNGAEEISIPVGATEFAFANKLGYGDVYEVSVKEQPAHQVCNVVSPTLDGIAGRDVAGRLTEINVVVTCQVKRFNVVVNTAKPLKGLILTNGTAGGSIELAGTETTVSFPVVFGESYGITVLKQPETGGPCTVRNGAGVLLQDDNVSTAILDCP